MADQASMVDIDSKPDLTHDGDANSGHKRKRGSLDNGGARPAPSDRISPLNNTTTTADLTDQDTANFLAAHNASGNGDNDNGLVSSASLNSSAHQQRAQQKNVASNINPSSLNTAMAALHYTMTVPDTSEMTFSQYLASRDNQPMGGSFSTDDQGAQGVTDFSNALKAGSQPSNPSAGPDQSPPGGSAHKPPVGSDEWHKIRRDNHKEVERRRRETINEGINELAKIVPGCEKNKGSILQRAVQFIQQLKENESQNIEKWTLEKLLTEQAITELSASVDKFKSDLQRAYEELEIYKRACQNAGITPDEFKDQGDNAGQNGES